MQGEEEVQPLRYELRGMGHTPEDILFYVDVDAEVSVEMKLGTQGKGLCCLDAVSKPSSCSCTPSSWRMRTTDSPSPRSATPLLGYEDALTSHVLGFRVSCQLPS